MTLRFKSYFENLLKYSQKEKKESKYKKESNEQKVFY